MPRILVIDDESHVRATVKLGLESKGFEVVAAESAVAGLRAFESSSFDLAIVDIFMPGMDGVKLIKALRERNPGFRVVAMSGVHLSGSPRTALDYLPMAPELSDVTCLKKPFRAAELMQAVEKAMGASAAAQAESSAAQ
jgi:CheY-like chemotaxis protein